MFGSGAGFVVDNSQPVPFQSTDKVTAVAAEVLGGGFSLTDPDMAMLDQFLGHIPGDVEDPEIPAGISEAGLDPDTGRVQERRRRTPVNIEPMTREKIALLTREQRRERRLAKNRDSAAKYSM